MSDPAFLLESANGVDGAPCLRLAGPVTLVDAASDDPVLRAMGFEPVAHDVLAERCNLDSAALSARLLALELEGQVALLPGGAFQRLR